MNKEVKKERYRKLSIAALVTGILAFSPLFMRLGPTIVKFIPSLIDNIAVLRLITSIQFLFFGLPIAAVVCGSIDLKRIKAGRYSRKGRGFDIAGIVLGGVFILIVLVFVYLEEILPRL
jgi:hypothetical protein